MTAASPHARAAPHRFALGLLAALAWTGVCSGAARAKDIVLTIDFAKIMMLEKPAGTIAVGNPGIADVIVDEENPTLIVLTGKAAGTTNLIVLDAEGKEMLNEQVRVSSDVRQLTTVFYGTKRQTLSCAPRCEQVISVGDDKDRFDTAKTQIEGRQSFSEPK